MEIGLVFTVLNLCVKGSNILHQSGLIGFRLSVYSKLT